ncbi:MAG: RluA family pseudouridine synthase [Phycisphaerae bacterium]|nr:RluA family pseudouridine synthase [Phycisphaerae bacterium]
MSRAPDDDDLIERPAADQESEDEDARELVRLTIRRKLPGRRLDKYLQGRFAQLSRTAIQKLIKDGSILVNGHATKSSYEMNTGDVIDLTLPKPEPAELVPENIPIEIIYEDEYLIAINKAAGIICHPARQYQTGTIANAVMYHSATLSTGSAPWRPGIVHRLDKNTTGIMLIAKTDEAHWRLGLQFERRTVQKTYLAVVHGRPPLDADTIDAPIGVHPVVREKFAVLIRENKIDVGKSAVTHYEVAERYPGFSLVKMHPKTGRTHQLRVHMSHIGFPIFGDLMYGGRAMSELQIRGTGTSDPLFEHQALHAWRIEFAHPIHEKRLQLEAPFPPAFKRLVTLLRGLSEGAR